MSYRSRIDCENPTIDPLYVELGYLAVSLKRTYNLQTFWRLILAVFA